MQKLLEIAMSCPDELVLQMDYVDAKGHKTTRIVSPIRFLAHGRFLGLCLCRCEPRQFHVSRCSHVELRPAANYVMPVAQPA